MVPHHPRAWQQYCCSNDSNSRPVRARDSWISAANLDKCHLVVRWRRSDPSPIDSPPDLAACLQNTSGVLSSLPTMPPGVGSARIAVCFLKFRKRSFSADARFFIGPIQHGGLFIPFRQAGGLAQAPSGSNGLNRESSRACCEKSRGFVRATSKIDLNQKAQLLLVR